MERDEWLDRLDPKRERSNRVYMSQDYEIISRDEANDWLSRVKDDFQRSKNEIQVSKYTVDMNAGDWAVGTPMIVFDGRGRLINGQHVLSAFVKSDMKTLQVVWQINKDPKAYMAFDHNRKRTPRDTLKWNGVERAGEMQAAAISLFQYEQGFFRGKGYLAARAGDKFPTDAQVQKVITYHPGLEKHLWKNPFKGKGISVGAVCAASYILHNIDRKLAEKFFQGFIEGINLPAKSPILVLRKNIQDLDDGERMRNGDTMARIFKAWNIFVRGESVSGSLFRKDESFPEPLHPRDLEPVSPHPRGTVQ